MTKVFSSICIALAVLLLTLAAMLKFYAVPALAKAPISPGQSNGGVNTSHQAGVAVRLFDPATMKERNDVPLTVTRLTKGDVAASQTPDALAGDIAVWDSFQRVEDNTGTVISASTERYAFNRVTSELSACCGTNVDGATGNFTGVMPLKFPMGTQAQDYQYFDSSLMAPATISYSGTEEVQGLLTYKFVNHIGPVQTGEMEVPGDLVGSTEPSFKAPRFFEGNLTLWVEPNTGAIINGVSDQKQTLRGPDGTDHLTIIEGTLGSTPEDISSTIDAVRPQATELVLLGAVVPLVGLIVGLVLLAVGIVLILISRRQAVARASGASAPPVNLAKD